MGIITNKPGRQNIRKLGRKGKLYKPYGFGQEGGVTPPVADAVLTPGGSGFTVGYPGSNAADGTLVPDVWAGSTIKVLEATSTFGFLQTSVNQQINGATQLTIDYGPGTIFVYDWDAVDLRYEVQSGAVRIFYDANIGVPLDLFITDTS